MGNVVNFTEDRTGTTIWQQKLRYTFNAAKVEAFDKYKAGSEVLPRKKRPFRVMIYTQG